MRFASVQRQAFAVILMMSGMATGLRAQRGDASDVGCALRRGTYVCNWSSFQLVFDRAHTIAIETQPMDRFTRKQLEGMVQQLGKVDVPKGAPADITLLLIPVQPNGINLGPEDHDLATLQVYARGEGSLHGALLWAETLRGQGDRPWPAQVHALVEQFEARFGKGQG